MFSFASAARTIGVIAALGAAALGLLAFAETKLAPGTAIALAARHQAPRGDAGRSRWISPCGLMATAFRKAKAR